MVSIRRCARRREKTLSCSSAREGNSLSHAHLLPHTSSLLDFSTYTMPRRTTVRLVLVALVALATSATLADAQSAGRASARPAVISGRRPGDDVQVDRHSSRGNKNDKPSKWGELCGGFGVTP